MNMPPYVIQGRQGAESARSRWPCLILGLSLALFLLASSAIAQPEPSQGVEQWGMFELTLDGPIPNPDPFSIQFSATFSYGTRRIDVDGFYDGNDQYKLRFMPDSQGLWTYVTHSSVPELNDRTGHLYCVPPGPDNHGPVRVHRTHHFQYADGTPFLPFGTTSYGMAQVEKAKFRQTILALSSYGAHQGTRPFNKVRLSALPHRPTSELDPFNDRYRDAHTEEAYLDGTSKQQFNPKWFQLIDRAISNLQDLGIQADLILFHAYAQPNPNEFTPTQANALARYLVARFGAYRNVWWSLANEYEFITMWQPQDWQRIGHLIQKSDPYGHLTSIHTKPNGIGPWSSAWCTHVSTQRPVDNNSSNRNIMRRLREVFEKPCINDEYRYEGFPNFYKEYGRLTPEMAMHGVLKMLFSGWYATHGETLRQQFFRGGGQLHGDSPQRIAFARHLFELVLGGRPFEPIENDLDGIRYGYQTYLYYYGLEPSSKKTYVMPTQLSYRVTLFDVWDMTTTDLGLHSGTITIPLPGKPFALVWLERQG